MSTVRSALPASLAVACLLAVASPTHAAQAPAQPAPAPIVNPPTQSSPTPAPVTPSVQRPAATATTPGPTNTPPVATPAPAPTTAATPTAQPTQSPGAMPAAPLPDPAAAPATPEDAVQPDPAPTPASPGLAEQLLGPSVNQHPTQRPTERLPTEAESAAAEDAAVAAMYRELYRPPNNPGRLNISARLLYGILGSADSTFSGRMGGLTADVGQSFNKIGYALTVVAQFGSLLHTTSGRQTQSIGLIGGGPTLTLGRLGLLQRGMLDMRIGYDFLVAPTRLVVDGTATSDGIRVPHGPRIAINMGLMTNPGRARKLFHSFGLTIGYQALVHDLKGQLPFSNVLQFGLFWWGG